MVADAQSCTDSFAFFSSAPLVVQQPPAHRLLVIIPVRRDCCSWQCSSSARVTYFTTPTSTTFQPARPGVDFVEGRGAVLFDVGQQRAQVAVEILPALVGDWRPADSTPPYQRTFAIVLEAPANASALVRVSTEIIVEPTHVHKDISLPAAAPIISTVAGILAAAGLVALAVCWFRVQRCCLPRRARPFEYKVLLLPRRDSGASEETREVVTPTSTRPAKKSGVRRPAQRASSFKNWRAIAEHLRQETSGHVTPEDEGGEEVKAAVDEKGSSENAGDDSDPERDLRKHLASIQNATR
ncbi:hypothetical protein PRNP1_010212 [Phytophthora ramorum]